MDRLVSLGRGLAGLGELYWSPAGPQAPEAFEEALSDWRAALALFLRHYGYERAGRAPRYPVAAREAVLALSDQPPTPDLVAAAWAGFLDRLGGNKPNADRNPLSPDGSVLRLVLDLGAFDHNLVRWAADAAERGALGEAHRRLTTVRGVGDKIAAFFLRDVVDAFRLPPPGRDAAVFVQPVDTWVRRGAVALAPRLGLPPPMHEPDEHARVLVALAEAARVRHTLVNTGLWALGARFAKSEDRLAAALSSERAFRNAVAGCVFD